MIKTISTAKVDGSNKVFGGFIYNINFDKNDQGLYTISVHCISEDGEYITPNLSNPAPSVISVGNLNIDGILSGYDIVKSPSGNTLVLEYVDTSIVLDQKFVGLPKIHGEIGSAPPNVILAAVKDGKPFSRLRAVANKMIDEGIPAYNAQGWMIGDHKSLMGRDLLKNIEENIENYEYNLSMLVENAQSKGISFDLNGIDITQFDKYYVKDTGMLRTILEKILDDLTLGYFWYNNKVVLVNRNNSESFDNIKNYVDGLGLTDISNYSENLSVRNNLNKSLICFYNQPKGKYRDKMSRRLIYNHLPPLWFGLSVPQDELIAIQNGDSKIISLKDAARDKAVIIKLAELRGLEVAAWAAIVEGTRYQYRWTFNSNSADLGAIGNGTFIKSYLEKEGRKDSLNNKKFYNMFLIDSVSPALDYIEFFGKFYYKTGSERLGYPGTFYSYDAKIHQTEMGQLIRDPTILNATIGEVFNLSAYAGVNTRMRMGFNSKSDKPGVYIIKKEPGKWTYKRGGAERAAGRFEDLISSWDELQQQIDIILANIQIIQYNESYSKLNLEAYDIESVKSIIRISDNFYTLANMAWINFIKYSSEAPDTYTVPSPGSYYFVTWPKKELSTTIGSTASTSNIANDISDVEVTPEDIFGSNNPAHENPLAGIINNMIGLDLLSSKSLEIYGGGVDNQTSPLGSITLETSTLDQFNDTKEFFRHMRSLNVSMSENGYSIKVTFANQHRKLMPPEVRRALGTLKKELKALMPETKYTKSTKPKVIDADDNISHLGTRYGSTI